MAGLYMAAVMVARLQRLSAAQWEEPQKFPACATNFSERPLPRSFGSISEQKKKQVEKIYNCIHINNFNPPLEEHSSMGGIPGQHKFEGVTKHKQQLHYYMLKKVRLTLPCCALSTTEWKIQQANDAGVDNWPKASNNPKHRTKKKP